MIILVPSKWYWPCATGGLVPCAWSGVDADGQIFTVYLAWY